MQHDVVAPLVESAERGVGELRVGQCGAALEPEVAEREEAAMLVGRRLRGEDTGGGDQAGEYQHAGDVDQHRPEAYRVGVPASAAETMTKVPYIMSESSAIVRSFFDASAV